MNILITLRPAEPQDNADIYRVHKAAVNFTCRKSYTPTIRKAWLSKIPTDSCTGTDESGKRQMYVIEYKETIQGFCQLNPEQSELAALYVHPAFHNQGLGTAMLRHIEEQAVRADLNFLKIYSSLNAVGFYKLNGYEEISKAFLTIGQETQTDIPCLLMRKYL
ncbi:MAG: GNAT family N-acetyltransferase [Neisseria sp.]|nr:GNAT family N-acetyltransferase [Neisseria sp.]